MNTHVARGLRYFGAILVLVLAWLGITGGIQQWGESVTLGQRVQTLAQFTYGILSLVTVALLFGALRFARTAQLAWLVSLTIAGALAPVVWGDTGWGTGLAAGISTLLIGLVILWLLRRGSDAHSTGVPTA